MVVPSLPSDMLIDCLYGRYLVRPLGHENGKAKPKAIFVPGFDGVDQILPVLLFSSSIAKLSGEAFAQQIELFKAKDDVFSADFLSGIVLIQSPSALEPKAFEQAEIYSIQSSLSWEIKTVLLLPPFPDGSLLHSGPYFLYRGYVYEAWKLYADELSAFQTTVIRDVDDPYR
jgi:hypothetical protein